MADKKYRHIWLWLLLLVIAGGGILGTLRWRTAQSVPVVFGDLPEAMHPSTFGGQDVAKRWRYVYLDPEGLESLSEIGARFRLNLFPDIDVTGIVGAHRTYAHGGQAVVGHLENDPVDSTVVINRYGDFMMGNIMMADGRQLIFSNVGKGGNQYVVYEVDNLKPGSCGTCSFETKQRQQGPAAENRPKPTGVKTSSRGDLGAFTRRLAAAGSKVPYAPCGHPLQIPKGSSVRMERARSMLETLGAPQPILAAAAGKSTAKYSLLPNNGTTGMKLGPTTPQAARYQKRGFLEYIDVLFLYTDALLTAQGGGAAPTYPGHAAIQVGIDNMITSINQVFLDSLIPIEVRQACLDPTVNISNPANLDNNFIFRARARGMTAMGDTWPTNAAEVVASGYPSSGPMWTQTQAPVRPDYMTGIADRDNWTVWNPIVGVGTYNQKQALAATYQPYMVNAKSTSVSGYLGWLTNRNNSLLRGDQYWGAGSFFDGHYVKYFDMDINATLGEEFEKKRYMTVDRTNQGWGSHTEPPTGTPMRFLSSGLSTPSGLVADVNGTAYITHNVNSSAAGSGAITTNTVLYFRRGARTGGGWFGGGGANENFSMHSTLDEALGGVFPVTVNKSFPGPADTQRNLVLQEVGVGTRQVHTSEPFINVRENFTWTILPTTMGMEKLFYGFDNRGLASGPVDHPQARHSLEDGSRTHLFVNRYDYDYDDTNPATGAPGTGNQTHYGTAYNPFYSGTLGLRMDLNGTDYAQQDFNGSPVPHPTEIARYPNLHRYTEVPYVPTQNAREPRADLVVLLTEDLAGDYGIANKYINATPNGILSRTVGRGPNPPSNRVQESTFGTHEGTLLTGSSISRTFTDLPILNLNSGGSETGVGTTGLLAYWPFEGNLSDLTGNAHHGTAVGGTASYIPDRHGNASNALSLDGSTHLTAALPNTFNFEANTSWSITGWVQPTDIEDEAGLITQWNSAGNNSYFQFGLRNTRLSSESAPLKPANNGNLGSALGNTTEWRHLAYVYDRKGIGGDGGVKPIEAEVPSTGLVLHYPFSGNPNDVSGNYNHGILGGVTKPQIPTAGLVAYYPFNGNANDESGNNRHGTPQNSASTADRNNEAGKAWNFVNNVNSRIQVPSNSAFTFGNAMTISLWTKFNQGWNYHKESLVWKGNGKYTIGVDQNSGLYGPGKYRIEFRVNTVSGNILAKKIVDYADISKWFHVTCVFSGGTAYLYVDGNLVSTDNTGGATVADADDSFIMGGSSNPVSGAYNRNIDEVRVYNRALSDSEVSALYFGGGAPVRYVKPGATGANDGSSWVDAFTDLQAALTASNSGDEIWVAAGTYRPTTNLNDRTASFTPKAGVKIYGGFAGSETSRSQRDWRLNRTILTGDLFGNDNANISRTEPTRGENSLHVINIQNKATEVVLDGLIVTGGNADTAVWGSPGDVSNGGGLRLITSTLTIRNCIFEKNTASKSACIYGESAGNTLRIENTIFQDNVSHSAGTMHVAGNYVIESCVFYNNHTKDSPYGYQWGGGLFLGGSSSGTINNSVFANNYAKDAGGAIMSQANAVITNCSFYGNSVENVGGALGQTLRTNGGALTLKNCIIWGSSGGGSVIDGSTTITHSIIQGGHAGAGNLNVDPQFLNVANLIGADGVWGTADDGLQLKTGSPAVDAGSNADVVGNDDLTGRTRIVDGNSDTTATVDMGAYERQTGSGSGPAAANPAAPTLAIDRASNADSAYSFDGNDTIETVTTVSFTSHTMSAWVKTSDNNAGIVSTDDSGGNWGQLFLTPTGRFSAEITNSGGQTKQYQSENQINDGQWHHVAYTYDAGTQELLVYLDGQLEPVTKVSDVSMPGFSVLNEEVRVGIDRAENNDTRIAGSIDEVTLHSRVLSAAEIAAMHGGTQTWAGTGKIRRYINGMLYDEIGMNNATATFTGNEFLIGRDPIRGKNFQGGLDELRVYGVPLTAGEVIDIYLAERISAPFTPSSNLVLHYPFTRPDWRNDISPSANHGSPIGTANASVPDRFGVADSALVLDGNRSYFRTLGTTNFPRGTQEFTYSAWIKPDKLLAPDSRLDLIVGNEVGEESRVWLGEGNGSLRSFVGSHKLPGAKYHDTRAVEVVDLNADGLPDVITGNWNQPEVTYLNTGNGEFVETWKSQDANATTDIALGDVSGDGRVDLLVARDNNRTTLLYLGLGDGTFAEPPTALETSSQLQFSDLIGLVAYYPFSGDTQDASLAPKNHATRRNGASFVMDRMGTAATALQMAPTVGSPQYLETQTSTDFPKNTDDFTVSLWVRPKGMFSPDGMPDIVRGEYGGVTKVFPGYGNGSFMAARDLGGSRNTVALELQDVDGDGKPDLIEAAHDQINQYRLMIESNGSFGPAQQIDASSSPTLSMAAGDLDSDGDIDLIFGNNASAKDEIWHNDNNTGFVLREQMQGYMPINPIPTGASLHLPLDGGAATVGWDRAANRNGTMVGYGTSNTTDAIVSVLSRHGRPDNAVHFLVGNNGTGVGKIEWTAPDVDSILGGAQELSVSLWIMPDPGQDLQNDRIINYSAALNNQPRYRLMGTTTVDTRLLTKWGIDNQQDTQTTAGLTVGVWNHVVTVHKFVPGPPVRGRNLTYINGVLRANNTAPLGSSLLNTGLTLQIGSEFQNAQFAPRIKVDDVRFYKDKVLEAADVMELYQESPPIVPETKGDTLAIAIGEMGGNATSKEIVVVGPNNASALYQQNLNPGIPEPWVSTADYGVKRYLDLNMTDARAVQMADLNNDGRLDVVVGNHNASNQVYLNAAAAGNWTYNTTPVVSSEWISPGGNATQALVLIDISGDGRPDILTAERNSTSLYYENHGNGTFKAPTSLGVAVGNASALWGADLNGDSHKDIVLGYESGADRFYAGNSTGTFAAGQVLPGTSGNTTALLSADITGTGQQVLVAGKEPGQFELRLNAADWMSPNNATLEFYTGNATSPTMSTANLEWYPGRWYHLVLRRSHNSTVSLFRDGVQILSQTVLTGNNATNLNLDFGFSTAADSRNPNWGMYPYNGEMDEFRLYNRALTNFEVAQLYNMDTPKKFGAAYGLAGHYQFDEGDGRDSGLLGNNGTLKGSVRRVTDRLGRPNKAVEFNGTAQYLEVSSATAGNFSAFNMPNTKSLTLSAWVKPDSLLANNWILANRDGGSQVNYQMALNNSRLVADVDPLMPAGNGTADTSAPSSSDGWYHVVTVVDRGSSASGYTETLAGTGVAGTEGDGGQAVEARVGTPIIAVASDGTTYIGDPTARTVRKVNTAGVISHFAGAGGTVNVGDGLQATLASFAEIQSMTVDSVRNRLYIHTGATVRWINLTSGVINTVGGLTLTSGNGTSGLAVNSAGTLYVCDPVGVRVHSVANPTAGTPTVSVAAGNGSVGFAGDGGSATTNCMLIYPKDLAVDASDNLFILDGYNLAGAFRVRKVTGGIIDTVAGSAFVNFTGDGGQAVGAGFQEPKAIAVTGSHLYVTDRGRIRVVDLVRGTISTMAGSGAPSYGGDGMPPASTSLDVVGSSLGFDGAGNLYFGDASYRVRRIRYQDGLVRGTVTRYVNGIHQGEDTLGNATGTFFGTTLLVGADAGNSSYFSGQLDDVRIYDRALIPGEVAQLYQLTPVFIPTDSRGLVLGDMDNDDDLDVFVANYNQENIWFENDGAGAFDKSRKVYAGVNDNSTGVVMARINSDVYPDLLVLNENEANLWYPAFPPGRGFQPSRAVGSETNNTATALLVDIDGDGDNDVIYGNHNASNSVYRNIGGGVFSSYGALDATDTNNSNALAAGDFDEDGDLDVVVGNSGAVNRVFLNSGMGTFVAGPTIRGAVAGKTRSLAIMDVAGDKRVLFSNQKIGHLALHLEPQNGNQGGRLQFFTGGQMACEMSVDHKWNESAWHHLVVTRDSSGVVSIYVNGLQTGVANVPTLANGATGADMVMDTGYRVATSHFPYKGAIDDIRLYNRALNVSEVIDLHRYELTGGFVTPPNPSLGMVAYWKLDGDAVDSAGVYNLNGAPMNVSTVPDRLQQAGGAYEFNSSLALPSLVNMGNSPVLNPGSNFAVSMWVGPPSSGNLSGTIMSKGGKGNSTRGWMIECNATSGFMQFHTSTNGTADTSDNQILSSSKVINDGNWHHVVAEIVGGEKRIYIDGVIDTNASYTGTVYASGERFLLGVDDFLGPMAKFNGRLDQVRVYNIPLNAAGVKNLYDLEKPGRPGSATITVNFVDNVVDLNEYVRLDLYRDTDLSLVPFLTFNGTSIESMTQTFNSVNTGNAWQNLRGGWKVTSEKGQMTVDNVVIRVTTSLGVYGITHQMYRNPAENIFGFNAQMNRDVFYGAVVQFNKAVPNHTFAHEIGHLLSGSHGLGDDAGVDVINSTHTFSPYGSNYNYVNDEFLSMGNHFTAPGLNNPFVPYCTIMALPGTAYARIPRFSSPNVLWSGMQTGYHHNRYLPPPFGDFTQPLYLDNSRAMTIIGQVVSLYRDSNGTRRVTPDTSVSFNPPRGLGLPVPSVTPTKNPLLYYKPPRGLPDAQVQRRQTAQAIQPSRTRPVVGPGARTGSNAGPGLGATVNTTPRQPSTPSQPGGGTSHPSGGNMGNQKPPRPVSPVAPRPVNPRPAKGIPGTVKPGGVRPPQPNNPKSPLVKSRVPNDNPEGSFVLQLRPLLGNRWQAQGSGHNQGASAGQGEAAGVRTGDGRRMWHGRSVWWVLHVPQNGVYEIDANTIGSSIDTTLTVVQPGGKSTGNDNDRQQPAPSSRVKIARATLSKGDKVYFSIDGVSGAQGRVKLNVMLKRLQ